MFRNSLPASVEMLGNSVRRHRLYRYQRNDRSPRRVSYGLENISFHDFGQKYETKRLQMSSATERFRKIPLRSAGSPGDQIKVAVLKFD